MNFDQKAQDWDNDPKKIERAAAFAQEIKTFMQPFPKRHALEVGCGTGLLSFMLQSEFDHITLTDTSEGMIQVLQEKIIQQGIRHFEPYLVDIMDTTQNFATMDVVYTMMALHHIHDLSKAFQTFNALLNPHGFVCIADLVTEDGSFHASLGDFDGHFGFDRADLQTLMRQNGFEEVFYKICYTIKKPIENGFKEYPLFLMIGKKKE